MHVVGERLLAVDRDDGDALAVAPLELRVAVDPDLLELEPHLAGDLVQDPARGSAEVAAVGGKQRDPADGYG